MHNADYEEVRNETCAKDQDVETKRILLRINNAITDSPVAKVDIETRKN
jgi:hypothetical protein